VPSTFEAIVKFTKYSRVSFWDGSFYNQIFEKAIPL